jgi:predicted metalloprotease
LRATRLIVPLAALALTLSACSKDPWNAHSQPTTAPTTTPQTQTNGPAGNANPTASVSPTTSPSAAPTPQQVAFKATIPIRTGPGFRSGAGDADQEYDAGQYSLDAFRALTAFWQGMFTNAGYTWGMTQPTLVQNSLTFSTKCSQVGTVTPTSPLFYCPSDGDTQVHGFIYLPTATFWTAVQSQPTQVLRNFAAAVMVANLFSYNVISMFVINLKLPSLGDGQARLMASCLTGVWVHAAYPADEFDPQKYGGVEPLNASIAAFDDSVGLKPSGGGLPPFQAVKSAFDAGFNSLSVAACGNAYWVNTTWK